MIEIYTGTPGSGKSLHCASEIYNNVRRGRPCIGNFKFKAYSCNPKGNGGYIYIPNKSEDGICICPDFLIWFSEYIQKKENIRRIKEDYITLIIDECQLIFNNREWSKEGRPEWISFFTQHRKLGYHIILIAQNKEMIDKQIRAIIEYEIIHRKVVNIGKMGWIFDKIYGGGMHICVKVYLPINQKVGSEIYRADREIYQLYDSYNRF